MSDNGTNNSLERHNHHRPHHSPNDFFRRGNLHWVLLSLFSVLPIILIILRIYRKVSAYIESQRGRLDSNSRINSIGSHRNSSADIYTITIKQDYFNLAPPRYSIISMYPIPTTYEKPPPYSLTFS